MKQCCPSSAGAFRQHSVQLEQGGEIGQVWAFAGALCSLPAAPDPGKGWECTGAKGWAAPLAAAAVRELMGSFTLRPNVQAGDRELCAAALQGGV